jgi:hypothetical protein
MVTNRALQKSFGSHRKNTKCCSDGWHRWRFWFAFRHFGTHFAESFCMSKSSWMMAPNPSREMPSCSANDLAEIRWPSYLVNLINYLRSSDSLESSRTRRNTGGKITTFKLGHPIFEVGIWWCMVPLYFYHNSVNFLRRIALQEKIHYDSWCLAVVEIAHFTWHASFRHL